MSDYIYLGRAISQYSLQELQTVLNSLNAALARREAASKHEKFTTGSNGKQAMEFPPPNPEFLKLKNEIELEIKGRK
jgi:hypothetical protein